MFQTVYQSLNSFNVCYRDKPLPHRQPFFNQPALVKPSFVLWAPSLLSVCQLHFSEFASVMIYWYISLFSVFSIFSSSVNTNNELLIPFLIDSNVLLYRYCPHICGEKTILFNNNLNSAEELKESYLLYLRFNALNKSTVTEAYTVSDCDFLMSIQVQLKFFG